MFSPIPRKYGPAEDLLHVPRALEARRQRRSEVARAANALCTCVSQAHANRQHAFLHRLSTVGFLGHDYNRDPQCTSHTAPHSTSSFALHVPRTPETGRTQRSRALPILSALTSLGSRDPSGSLHQNYTAHRLDMQRPHRMLPRFPPLLSCIPVRFASLRPGNHKL